MNHEPRSVRTVVRRGRCRVAALALAVLSLMGGCATGPARTPEARPGAAAAQPYDAVGAAVGLGYERPPFYRIPPNYSFRETPAARGEEGAGFLAPPGDPDALAARILALLASERLRAETGSRLKERAALRFDPGGACRARRLAGWSS